MSKILFLMRYPLDEPDNLRRKFDGQMAAVRALGHEAVFFGWNREGVWLCGEGRRELVRRCPLACAPGYAHTLLHVDLLEALKAVAPKERFDLVYMRFLRAFGNAPSALLTAKESGAKLVVEHPTYPFANGKKDNLLRKPVFAYLDRVFARINPLVDLYTLIGEPANGALDGRPAMNIVNGVDVESLPLHSPRPRDPEVHLLALASMSRWQGYDRLLNAMAASAEPVILHMAGNEGDGSLAQWRALSQRLKLQSRVIFEGPAYGEKLDALIARCDVGVGGLGLYRKGQMRSMTLKLREYMARGLPFVYAVDDPSIPPDEPRFCLRVPNDDSLPDLAAIAAFARRAKADEEAPGLMRAYAQKHMSWTPIMQSVLERVEIPCPGL